MTPVELGNDTWVVLVSQVGSRWREQMTSMSFHSGGALPPQRHARSSTCPPQHRPQWAGHGHQEWCPVSSARNARGWGVTGRGWGVLRVGGAFVQYAQPLASGSRPSWSRPTRAHSWRTRRRTMTTGTLCRQRAGSGGGGPMTEASGCAVRTPDSLLRGLVSTALTLPSLPANHPAEIVGILRFFFGVQRRCGVDVSTVDTHTPSCLAPKPPRPLDHQPAPGSLPSECLRHHDTHLSQK